MPAHALSRLPLIVLLALCAVAFAGAQLTQPAAAQSGGERYRVYLPQVRGTGNPSPQPPAPQPPAPQPGGVDGAFFFEPEAKTASSSTAIDAQGGLHVAYYYYRSENEGGANVVYSYCAPPANRCTTEAGWQRVELFGPVESVQLQLTPEGKPRLLAEETGLRNSIYLRTFYTYAECDENCLNAASWRSTEVDAVLAGYIPAPRETPRRNFALDRLGRPHFIASDFGSSVNNETRYGSFLYGCETACSDVANWTVAPFTPQNPDSGRADYLDNAVLKFTAANQPRALGEYRPTNPDDGYVTQIAYFACDGACDDAMNWSMTPLSPRGDGPKPAWDLELTAEGQPRAVVFHESTGDERSYRLFFFQCAADCASESSWTTVNLALPEHVGLGADLALDSAGRPRVAHLSNSAILVYSWCQNSCGTSDSWLHGIAERPEALDAARVVVIPSGCVTGLWDNYGVSMALDPQGNPRISYDATYQAQCAHNPKPGQPPTAGFYEVAHLIRMYITYQP
jgi:hypothetical protein